MEQQLVLLRPKAEALLKLISGIQKEITKLLGKPEDQDSLVAAMNFIDQPMKVWRIIQLQSLMCQTVVELTTLVAQLCSERDEVVREYQEIKPEMDALNEEINKRLKSIDESIKRTEEIGDDTTRRLELLMDIGEAQTR